EFLKDRKVFASTEGAFVEQEFVESGAGLEATATNEADFQSRSYPNSFGHQQGAAGYEYIEAMRLDAHGGRIAEEAVALLTAPQCPSGIKTIILDASQVALQIHESCGHPTELDRVFGMEAAYAGTSFMTPDKLNALHYASREPRAGDLLAGGDDRRDQGRRVHGDQSQLEHRRQAAELPVRHPARLRDRQRQARPDAEERHLRGQHPRVLELLRCRWWARRMAALGTDQLRQGTAAPAGPRGPRGGPGPVPERAGGHPEVKAVESPGLTDATSLRAFMEVIIERSPADETEVLVTEQDGALTRFANNGIHQNVAERNTTVRVRVVKNGKTGVA